MRHGALWAYNLNYFDWLTQEGMTIDEGAQWIDRFVEDIPYSHIGLDPYPTALRGINWIKFICRHSATLPAAKVEAWNASLYSQYRLLAQRLEYHLLGNHLLEDAYSLCIVAVYFADKRMWRKASHLLRQELTEQTLADGAHYEQSPMYHCILLDRLLDVYNFSKSNPRFGGEQEALNDFLQQKAVAMLGHLENMTYQDGSFPLFNDAARGIAPTPGQIKDYARRLGLIWQALSLGACGYRHLQTGTFEAFVDVGSIAASYQSGHSHADALNFELRIDGQPFIVDTGISTYDKTPRRQYERSTVAHNTVVVDGQDSAEVWGGFRVARRSRVNILKDEPTEVSARATGVGRNLWHERTFTLTDHSFIICDHIAKGHRGTARLHLAPSVEVISCAPTSVRTTLATIEIMGATTVHVASEKASTCYNRFEDILVIEMEFADALTVSIRV